jgi:hypothetical protein
MAEPQIDEGLGYLQAFIADLGQKQTDLGAVGERLGALQSDLDAMTGHLDASRDRVSQLGDDRQAQLDGALGEVDEAVGGLLEDGQQTAQKLTDVVSAAFDERHDQLTTRSDEHVERLDGGAQQLHEQGFAVADQAVQTADATLQDLRGRTDTGFEELGAKLADLTGTVNTSAEATTDTLESAGEQTQGDLLELVTTGFDSFSEVTDHLMGDDGVVGAFGGFAADLEGGFGQLGASITGLGDQLCEQVDGLISSTVEVIDQETVGRLQEEFEKVVIGSVEDLVTDFADSIVTMNTGAAITAAVAPFVPELAAAKAVISTIDDLLESLMLG